MNKTNLFVMGFIGYIYSLAGAFMTAIMIDGGNLIVMPMTLIGVLWFFHCMTLMGEDK